MTPELPRAADDTCCCGSSVTRRSLVCAASLTHAWLTVLFSPPRLAAAMCSSAAASAPCCTTTLPLLTEPVCPRSQPHCLFPFFTTFFFERFFQVSGTRIAPVSSFLSCCTFSRIAGLVWLCQQGSGQEGVTSLCSCCHGGL